jgi:hypothetical protein
LKFSTSFCWWADGSLGTVTAFIFSTNWRMSTQMHWMYARELAGMLAWKVARKDTLAERMATALSKWPWKKSAAV